MPTIYEHIATNLDKTPKASTETIAYTIERDLNLNKTQRDVLHPLIAQAIDTWKRTNARRLEKAAFKRPAGGSHRNEIGLDPIDGDKARHKLAHETVVLWRGGPRVPWGQMTVEQHDQRIEYLKTIRGGIDHSIDRHVRAVELITAAGVTCLNELPDWTDLEPPAVTGDLDEVS